MPTTVIRSKPPSFYLPEPKQVVDSSTTSNEGLRRNWPLWIGIALAGVGIVFLLRSRDREPVQSGAVLTLVPSTDPDQSQLDNLLQATRAIIDRRSGAGGNTGVSGGTVPSVTGPSGVNANDFGSNENVPATINSGGSIANLTAAGFSPNEQAAYDKVLAYGGNILTVGSENLGVAPQPTNLSLVDWFKYQYSKVAAAKSGTIIGESADFVARTTPEEYLRTTLTGGNISMYGPNAGPEQRALEDAARRQALAELYGSG